MSLASWEREALFSLNCIRGQRWALGCWTPSSQVCLQLASCWWPDALTPRLGLQTLYSLGFSGAAHLGDLLFGCWENRPMQSRPRLVFWCVKKRPPSLSWLPHVRHRPPTHDGISGGKQPHTQHLLGPTSFILSIQRSI